MFNWNDFMNDFPYTNFSDINVSWFLNKFKQIFDEWEGLYNQMLSWKTATDEYNATWRAQQEQAFTTWENNFQTAIDAWKVQTETDIGTWETDTIATLEAWKAVFINQYNALRVEVEQVAEDAETAKNSAQESATSAQQSADSASATALALQASLQQIDTNTNDITNLKTATNAEYTNLTEVGYITASGGNNSNSDYRRTPFIPFTKDDRFLLYNFYNVSALAYAFYTDAVFTAFISGAGNVDGNLSSDTITIPENTKYVRFSTNTTRRPDAKIIVENTLAVEAELRTERETAAALTASTNASRSATETLYSALTADYSIVGFINTAGSLTQSTSDYSSTDYIPIDNNSKIALHGVHTGVSALAYAFYSAQDDHAFISGTASIQSDTVVDTIPAGAKYVRLCSRITQGDNPRGVVFNYGQALQRIQAIEERLDSAEVNPLIGSDVLIFGDSITVTCTLTINSDDEVTAVQWRDTSYVDGQGQTIRYNKWANMLYNMNICREIRNYAYSGASYKDKTRQAGEELQDVSYQITVALNDLTNPNGAYAVDDFSPDIVIFALGTNDGAVSDTYADAMAKTVLKADGHSIDINATLNNLDKSKFCEAVRWAYLKCRQAFPTAQFYCVTPIQSPNHAGQLTDTLYNNLEAIAKRYGAFIIDGRSEVGIIEDNNVYSDFGDTLKDGLHPNEKGQNMMFKTIYGWIKSHYSVSDTLNT